MADHVALGRGDVKHIRRTGLNRACISFAQIERDAGHGGGIGSAPRLAVRAMEVATQQPCDLGMTFDRRRQIDGVLGVAVSVHVVGRDVERRMVHEKQRRPLRFVGERFLQPGAPPCAKHTFALSRGD